MTTCLKGPLLLPNKKYAYRLRQQHAAGAEKCAGCFGARRKPHKHLMPQATRLALYRLMHSAAKTAAFTCTIAEQSRAACRQHHYQAAEQPTKKPQKCSELSAGHTQGIKAAQDSINAGAYKLVRDTASVRSGSIPYGICVESSPILRHDLPSMRFSAFVPAGNPPDHAGTHSVSRPSASIRMYDRPDKHIQHAPKQRLLYFRNRFLPKGVDRQTQPSWLRAHTVVQAPPHAWRCRPNRIRKGVRRQPGTVQQRCNGTMPRPES